MRLLTSDKSTKERCRIINCYSVNQNSSVFHSSLYILVPGKWASSSIVWVMRTMLCRKTTNIYGDEIWDWRLTAWNFFGILDNTSLPSAQRHVAGFGKKKNASKFVMVNHEDYFPELFLIFFHVILSRIYLDILIVTNKSMQNNPKDGLKKKAVAKDLLRAKYFN